WQSTAGGKRASVCPVCRRLSSMTERGSDVNRPQHIRRVTEVAKVCFLLMDIIGRTPVLVLRHPRLQVDEDDFLVVLAIDREARRICTQTRQDELTGGKRFPVWGFLFGRSGADTVLEHRLLVVGWRAGALADVGHRVGTKQIPEEAAFKEGEVSL